MKKCLIISRYNEDLSWLNNLNKDFEIIIYNKGEDLETEIPNTINKLDNLGRESQTWLYYITNNYDNLADINIFLQGRIDDLGCMAYKDPNEYLNVIDEYGFAVSRYGILGPFHWKRNVGIENDLRYKVNWNKHKISRSKLGFRNFAKSLFPEIPYFVACSYGGCFAVKKENIMKFEIDFYKDLLHLLSKHENPIEGHYLERLWCYMFTKNKPLKKAFFDVIKTKFERYNFSSMSKIIFDKIRHGLK